VRYNSEMLSKAKVKYNTYGKEFFVLVQGLKQCHHYILAKETIFHTDHQPVIFINSHSKIKEQSLLKCEASIQ
jgi:hypothetical protein